MEGTTRDIWTEIAVEFLQNVYESNLKRIKQVIKAIENKVLGKFWNIKWVFCMGLDIFVVWRFDTAAILEWSSLLASVCTSFNVITLVQADCYCKKTIQIQKEYTFKSIFS